VIEGKSSAGSKLLRSRTVVEGEKKVALECPIAGARNPSNNVKYMWTLNGNVVGNTTRRYQTGTDLYFTNVLREYDEGIFGCWELKSYAPGDAPPSHSIQLRTICKLIDTLSVRLKCLESLKSENRFSLNLNELPRLHIYLP